MNERDLFWAAVQQPDPAARADFLNAACAGDDGRRRRLDDLLAAYDHGSGFLDSPACVINQNACETTHDTSVPDPTQADPPDRQLGPYRLIRPLGEGGMGTVWLAQQQDPVRRLVALKVIKPGMDSKPVLARFEAERQALALMEHPNIARVYDAGTTSAGRPYFVMEIVHGVPFTWYCDIGRLGVRERLQLFVNVCRAVQHAHQKGIIHRDLKPSNVLVAVQDGRPVPKVIDFGLAKALGRRLTERTLATEFGTLLGTPEYMAPEQADLDRPDTDVRSDIYSLGVLLYELLTGDTPLGRESVRRAGLGELLRRVREEEPPRPSARLAQLKGRQGLARLARGDLDWIVMKALEKDRDRRYPSADALAEDVVRHLNDEPVLARPPSAGYRLRKFARRHRTAVAAAAGFVLLLMASAGVGTGLTVWALRERDTAASAESRAKANEGDARSSEAEARAVLEFFQNRVLAAARPKSRTGGLGPEATIQAAVDAAEPHIGKEFAGQPLAEAAIRSALGKSYTYLGQYSRAIGQFERCLALRRERLGSAHPDTLSSMVNLGYVLRRALRFSEAGELFQEAHASFEEKYGRDHPDTIAAAAALAVTYLATGRPADAIRIQEEVLERARKALGPDHAGTINVMDDLAVTYLKLRRPGDAARLLEPVLKHYQNRHGPDHPITLTAMSHLAEAAGAEGRPDDAIPLYEEVLKRSRQSEGANHVESFMVMGDLAKACLAAGRPRDAAMYFEELLRFIEGHFGPTDRHTLEAMDNLAEAYMADRRWDRAEALVRQLIERKRMTAEGRSLLGASLADLGECLLEQHQYSHAESSLREALTMLQARDSQSWKTCSARGLLGVALMEQGRYAEAEPLLTQGYEGLRKRESRLPPGAKGHPRRFGDSLVRLYEASGESEKARTWRGRHALEMTTQSDRPE